VSTIALHHKLHQTQAACSSANCCCCCCSYTRVLARNDMRKNQPQCMHMHASLPKAPILPVPRSHAGIPHMQYQCSSGDLYAYMLLNLNYTNTTETKCHSIQSALLSSFDCTSALSAHNTVEYGLAHSHDCAVDMHVAHRHCAHTGYAVFAAKHLSLTNFVGDTSGDMTTINRRCNCPLQARRKRQSLIVCDTFT
jgi:hypothetical protein